MTTTQCTEGQAKSRAGRNINECLGVEAIYLPRCYTCTDSEPYIFYVSMYLCMYVSMYVSMYVCMYACMYYHDKGHTI